MIGRLCSSPQALDRNKRLEVSIKESSRTQWHSGGAHDHSQCERQQASRFEKADVLWSSRSPQLDAENACNARQSVVLTSRSMGGHLIFVMQLEPNLAH
jgi:hypothetical protein